MFGITKRIEVSGAHSLHLDYDSKCKDMHGHNWIITIHCRADEKHVVENQGMVIDFTHIKKRIVDALDHKLLNHVEGLRQPTAELLARWVCDRVPHCYRVEVQENEGNVAWYEKDAPSSC